MLKKTGPSKFYGWVMLPILCLVYSIPIGFAVYGPPVINTFMIEELKLQRGQVNLGYSIIGIMLGIGALFIPWLINRFGAKNTLAIGAFIIAFSSLMMALLGNICATVSGTVYPVVYWIICFFVGLGVSFGTVVPTQTIVLMWFNVHRALAMGLVLGGGAVGGFIFPQIISNCIIALGNDWRVGWYVIALACLIGAIVALIALCSRPEDLGQHPDGLSPEQLKQAATQARQHKIRTYRSPVNWELKKAFKTRSMWLILLSLSMAYFLWQVILTQAPAHMLDRGFSPMDPVLFLQPAFIYGMILGCSVLGRLSISVLGERIEARHIMTVAGTFLVAGCVLFWLASKENLWAVYLFPFLTGIGFGATYVSNPLIVGNYFGAESFPSISRILNPITSLFQYAAPTVAGVIFDINHSYLPAVLIAGTAGIIGTILIFICKPPVPDKAVE